MFGPLRGYAYIMADSHGRVEEPAPLPDYSEDGVDLTLIRWMLSLTPVERMQVLEEWVDGMLTIRELNGA